MAKFIDAQYIIGDLNYNAPIDGYMFSTITSNPSLLTKTGLVSVHAFCTATGSPVGTLTIQCSDQPGHFGGSAMIWTFDPVPATAPTNNWVTVQSYAISGATNILYQSVLAHKAVRVVYTPSSGTGRLFVAINTKNQGE